MSFHKDVSCYVYKYQYFDVMHVGYHFMSTKEEIPTRYATAETSFWKNVALTRYENGKVISIKVTQFQHFKTL